MVSALFILVAPAALDGIVVAILFPGATGFPTWAAVAQSRLASTLCPCATAGVLTFVLVQRLVALPAG